jgi:carbamoyltransferase
VPVSPFLGPEFNPEEIKQTLDNCKLSYEHLNENELIDVTVRALVRGQLVGWFQGRMEWGHRALGNRSIFASPVAPFVLENLNVFLKHRDRHRAYGVSVPVEQASRFFDGPPASRHMEYEYVPKDGQFSAIMPPGTRAIRVQTIPVQPEPGCSPRTHVLHEHFGESTGVPVLVNTSFNGLLEPMVCSPRDAIRVFYGSGLDLLVLDRFVVRK